MIFSHKNIHKYDLPGQGGIIHASCKRGGPTATAWFYRGWLFSVRTRIHRSISYLVVWFERVGTHHVSKDDLYVIVCVWKRNCHTHECVRRTWICEMFLACTRVSVQACQSNYHAHECVMPVRSFSHAYACLCTHVRATTMYTKMCGICSYVELSGIHTRVCRYVCMWGQLSCAWTWKDILYMYILHTHNIRGWGG